MAVIAQEIGDRFALYNADCMEVMPDLKSESIGCSIHSPPFPELYQYSNDPRDMSNCARYEEGVDQYRFVAAELHRLLKPGRLACVHCMDLKKGSMYQRDFPGDIVRVYEDAGFHFFCRVTIWKDPWLIARRTRMRGLMHKLIVQDSSQCRTAGADFVLVFRKGGTNPEPIRHPEGLTYYAGEKKIPGELLARYRDFKGDQRLNRLSHWIWRRYASPVWDDIRTGRLMPFKEARENEEEKHACPLQLDVIDRCLTLWSNPEDIVLTPFMGVGSEVAGALMNGRRAIGIELKSTYYRQAVANVKAILEAGPARQRELIPEVDSEPEDIDADVPEEVWDDE